MKKKVAFISILIGLLFFLNSSQYLSWFYNLTNFYDSYHVDFYGQFLGKIFQGIGIVIFCAYLRFYKNRPSQLVELASLIALNFILTVFSILSSPLHFYLSIGLLMNVAIGILYAWYVTLTIEIVPRDYYGISFGAGIGISCVFSYLLYKFDTTYVFMTSKYCLFLYAFISIISIILLLTNQKNTTNTNEIIPEGITDITSNYTKIVVLTLLTVSIINGLGYFVPSEDITAFHMNVEVMRLFYTIGLVIAGFINDRSRKIGLVLCLIALTFTFSMPLLRDNQTGIFITWMFSYLLGGFISVYRAIIFLDIAVATDNLYLAPIGLLLGRVGEPIGMLMRFYLAKDNALLILVISIFYAITLILFALLFSKLYVGVPAQTNEAVDIHGLFIDKYSLSSREIQILDEILEMKSNKEIAADLFITESTVKFHVKNLMKKTSCKNRNELISLYNNFQ